MATNVASSDRMPAYGDAPAYDIRSRLIFNSYLGNDRLIALAQPSDWSDRALGIAANALDALRATLLRTEYIADLSGGQRISRAIDAANETVLASNRAAAGNDLQRHCGVGMAIIMRSGKSATIALIAPVQVILFQGSQSTWLPSRESWISDAAGLGGQPLGWTDTVQPAFFTSQINHDDDILVTTSTIGAALAKLEKSPKTSSEACAEIGRMGASNQIDPYELIALSTRFEPASLAGNVRAVTNQVLGRVDRRARAVWSAVRTSD